MKIICSTYSFYYYLYVALCLYKMSNLTSALFKSVQPTIQSLLAFFQILTKSCSLKPCPLNWKRKIIDPNYAVSAEVLLAHGFRRIGQGRRRHQNDRWWSACMIFLFSDYCCGVLIDISSKLSQSSSPTYQQWVRFIRIDPGLTQSCFWGVLPCFTHPYLWVVVVVDWETPSNL